MNVHALRLTPGQDLRTSLHNFVREKNIGAGFVLTCVGSLLRARLRYAGASETITIQGPFEIVSLVGTLGQSGVHLHICLADAQGRVRGAHLAAGCIIHTCAELVLGEEKALCFTREQDPATGYRELVIRHLE